MQLEHNALEVLPGGEIKPTGHLPEQDIAPVLVWYIPAAQMEQLDAASSEAYRPAAQLEHAALLVLALADIDPAVQLPEHKFAPVLAWYIPAAQLRQLDEATSAA